MRFVRRIFLGLGLFCLGLFCYIHGEAYLSQLFQNRKLDRTLADASLRSSTESRKSNEPPMSSGMLIGRIDIPRVGVSAVIDEGDDESVLFKAVGHIPGTALPGKDGNIGLAAHRDSFFRGLRNVREGDEIVLTTPRDTFRYRVESIGVVRPEETSVLKPVGLPTLTLITCYPFHFIGPAPERYVVTAFQSPLQPSIQW